MTTKSHAVRLTRHQNREARLLSLAGEQSKEEYLAGLLAEIATVDVGTEPDWVITKVSVEDEVWAKVQAIAKARGVTVSALLSERVA